MGSYHFIGGCEFDVASGELRNDGTIARLEPQPAAVLALLASRAGDVVTHEEIRRGIWGDETHVNFQDSVHYCMRQVRAALGDRARSPRFIDTIPRRGYRLRADAILGVDPVAAPSSGLAASIEVSHPAATSHSTTWRRYVALLCLGVALGTATALVERRPNNHHRIAIAVLKSVHNLVF
jgi:DNA-binding winged helix-turn-helix (wHTH) protein